VTDGDGKVSTIKYSYFTLGLVTWTQDPKGAVVTRTYDYIGRPLQVTNQVSGAYTRYVYDNLTSVASFTTLKDLATEFYSITVFDGQGRVRAVVKDHPGSVGGYSSVYNIYDNMGRLQQQSNPTEIDGNGTPAG